MRKKVSDALKIALQQRINSGESINALAKAAKLDHAQLVRFIAGQRRLNHDAIDRLADMLGLTLR